MNINDFCAIVVTAMLIGAVAMFAVLLFNVNHQPRPNSSKRAEAQALR